mgnify:CR=1 FL=1
MTTVIACQAIHSTARILAMERVVAKKSMHDSDDDVDYWLSRPAAERIGAVEELRRTYYGSADGAEPRLSRVLRITRTS